MALLEVRDLTHRFGGVTALDRVSFQVERGSIVSVIGPNGAGKTTLFNCITGVICPTQGEILFGENPTQNLVGRRPDAVARLRIARTFQNIRLFRTMTVLENVMVGAYGRTRANLVQALLKRGFAQQEEFSNYEQAMQYLDWAGLKSEGERTASTLSYGMQRRLELARALASEPKLLLLDEPAAGLTAAEKRELLELLAQLKKRGLTLLLIEHDMQVVMPVSDRLIVLDHGAKIAEGSAPEIQSNPTVIDAYLGAKAQSCGDAASL